MIQLTPEYTRDVMFIGPEIFGRVTGWTEFPFYLDAIQSH